MTLAKRWLIGVGFSLCAAAAHATPVTYDLVLTPTLLGSPTPIFGIASLPAGPFSASLTLSSPLPPSLLVLTDEKANVLAFSATVGTKTWNLSGLGGAQFETDALGHVTAAEISAGGGADSTLLAIHFNLVPNIGWYAMEGFSSCQFDPLPLTGPCIAGDASSVRLSVRPAPAAVPEPATLSLTALGLTGVVRRYRRRSSHVSRSAV